MSPRKEASYPWVDTSLQTFSSILLHLGLPHLQGLSTLNEFLKLKGLTGRPPLELTESYAAPLLDTPRADSALMIRLQRSRRARRSRTPASTHPSQVHRTFAALLDACDAFTLTNTDLRLPFLRLQSQPPIQLLPARCALPAQRRRCLKVKSDAQALRSGPRTCPQTQVQLHDHDYAALHQGTFVARMTFPQSTRPEQLKWMAPPLRTFCKARSRSTESAC
ncbi:hypothetical protein B0H14DRAFT_3895936 [Mycena olivaceomarginata]|nr:hypothetical protein B0H14DRAFT_3895936 [Mycena olivaceomarginata]